MRRHLSILLAFVLAAAQPVPAIAAFSDVAGSVYEPAYTMLSQRGIVQAGKPNDPLLRAQAIKVVVEAHPELKARAQWHAQNMAPLPLFIDMRQQDWFAPYVETAFEALVVKGYPDGTLRPGKILTVEEAIVLLMRTFGLEGTETNAELSPYIANLPNQWFTPSINAAVHRNLVMRGTMLQLGSPITRGQFFDIVYRLITILELQTERFEDIAVVAQQGNTAVQALAPQVQGATVTANPTPHISVGQPAVQQVARADVPYASEQYFAISMPSLGIEDLTITHPTDPFSSNGVLDVLQHGVGHLFSYPGGGGKVMIYGHSSGYPWDVSQYTKIFRKVNQLEPGDRIYVTYAGHLYTYEVSYESTIDAKDTSPFSDDGTHEELILYTCWPPDSITQRYLVHAVPVETVALQ